MNLIGTRPGHKEAQYKGIPWRKSGGCRLLTPSICVLAAWLLIGSAACAEIGRVEKGAVTAEQERYAAPPGTAQFVPPAKGFAWQATCIDVQAPYSVHLLTFPSPCESPHPCNNTVYAEYYRPSVKGKSRAVIVLHIAGGDFELSRFIAGQLASSGIGALFVQMAYYGSRRPADKPQVRMLSEDVDLTRQAVIQSVMDIRRAGLWLSLRPEVDAQRIGIVGPSLGAMVGSLVAGVDPRFTRSAFIVGGGDLATMIWTSTLTARAKRNMIDKGMTFETLQQKVKEVDPLTYARNIAPRGVLMVNARRDTIVPPDCTLKLWEAMGRPQILWYDADHVQMLAYLFEVMNLVVAHFAADNW
jgi:dienelactone hydrolase